MPATQACYARMNAGILIALIMAPFIGAQHLHNHAGHGHDAGPSLLCNCTFGKSVSCSFEGTCDATHFALHKREHVQTARKTMLALQANPKDASAEQWRSSACAKLASPSDNDILLLEYEDWTPACLRLQSGAMSCGLGPAPTPYNRHSHGFVRLEDIDQAVQRLHDLLKCSRPARKLVAGYACYTDGCNDATPFPDAQPLNSPPSLWLTAGLPVGIVLLIIILLIIALVVYRSRLWKAVLRVSDRSRELSKYEDVGISEGDGGPIEPKAPRPDSLP